MGRCLLLAHRVLLVVVFHRTNLTARQPALLSEFLRLRSAGSSSALDPCWRWSRPRGRVSAWPGWGSSTEPPSQCAPARSVPRRGSTGSRRTCRSSSTQTVAWSSRAPAGRRGTRLTPTYGESRGSADRGSREDGHRRWRLPGPGLIVPHPRWAGRPLRRGQEENNAEHRRGQDTHRAHLRLDEELEDRPGLPPEGRRSPPRRPGRRHRAQPRPRRKNHQATGPLRLCDHNLPQHAADMAARHRTRDSGVRASLHLVEPSSGVSEFPHRFQSVWCHSSASGPGGCTAGSGPGPVSMRCSSVQATP